MFAGEETSNVGFVCSCFGDDHRGLYQEIFGNQFSVVVARVLLLFNLFDIVVYQAEVLEINLVIARESAFKIAERKVIRIDCEIESGMDVYRFVPYRAISLFCLWQRA